ncbi:hypothetical protein [Aromatoleum evansii]|uniref:hypothetical protein n=1 Tax=Aromatoleum evansii TaxID=59406 RepID=UPI00145CB61A|nr:hypothetical protein [Aromatoleum evansii]NMG32059.1 hypothetical protein [Aromatoleum evansii]
MADFNWNGDALLSSAVGALIGSALTLAGVYYSHWLQKRQNAQKDAEHLLGLLQGIHDEIETLWESYTSSVGAHSEALQDSIPLMVFWPITQDYFTIYNTNAFFIGKIRDHDLRKCIVATYSKARGLIDTYRLNNELLQKFEYATLLAQESQTTVHEANAQARYQVLVEYASQVKVRHIELKAMVAELLRRLRKEGVLSGNGPGKP